MRGSDINARLLSVARLVRQDAHFADIGTDHAYLPIFLLGTGRISRAVCTDINEGPIAIARSNIESAGLAERAECILTDGAEALSGLGITDYAICGMGGELISEILERAPHLMNKDTSIILQPMSKQAHLRRYLLSRGYRILTESYSDDAGKYYVAFLVSYDGAIRDIDEVTAELPAQNAEIVNESAQIGYFKARIRSLRRAIEGKMRAGEDTTFEMRISTEIEQCILKGRK